MKRKFIAVAGAAVLCIGMVLPSFAAVSSSARYGYGYGCAGYYDSDYGFMWDEDGNFLDEDAFAVKLDSLIEDGTFDEDDRDYFVDMYDWCAGGGRVSGRRGGGCCGGGRGW